MSEAGLAGRGKIDRRTAGRLAGAAAVVVALGAIIGPSVLTTHPNPTFPGAGGIAAGPSGSHRPSGTESPVASGQPWEDLEVPPFEQLADFVPNDGSVNGVALASSFTVRSRTSTPALEVARRIRIDPPVELNVQAGPTADVAIVKPTTALLEGLRYHVRLDAPDGALAGSWTFRTQAPLHVVSTVPGDRTSEVPTNTGIEVEFDQDGTQGFGDHFKIEPAATGRFEQRERVWSFVPNDPLAAATVYTVTVTPGVSIEGSRSTLDAAVTFQFETDRAKPATSVVRFDRPAFETRPGERPVLPLSESSYDEDTGAPVDPTAVTVDVHRLPTFDAAVAAAATLAGTDSWARYAPTGHVDTSGLTRIARVEGKVLRADAGSFVRLPFEPGAGFYVLTIVQDGPPAQLLLQVTNLAAYALTGTKDSVVWVNDLATGSALAGATVAVAHGASIGKTAADGLLRFATPASLLDVVPPGDREPDLRFVSVTATDGRRLIMPLGLRASWYSSGYEGPTIWDLRDDSSNWWLLFRTDRQTYRQTDTVNVSGLIRARSDRSVPGGLELRLRSDGSPADLAIQRVRIQATERGVFSAAIRFEDLPRGSYLLDLFAGAKLVSSLSIEINEIRKPAFKLDVETDRHVYVLGQLVHASAAAAFYDGTPVPGMALRFSAFGQQATSTSDSAGNAAAQLRARSDSDNEGWFEDAVVVAPAHPEEGQVDGSASMVMLPSRVWITGSGSLKAGRIVAQGTLSWADIKGMEAKLDAGSFLDWEGDGPGRPITSGTVTAHIYHEVVVRTRTGTTYDFIEKRVVPAYAYEYKEVAFGSRTLTSGVDGSFHMSFPAPVATDEYRVELIARDPEGRKFRRSVSISVPYRPGGSQAPFIVTQTACGYTPTVQAGLNEPVTVTMHDGNGSVARTGRFLFLVSEQGSMQATVMDAATFSRTLRDADLPGFRIRAVWLSDKGYFTSDAAVLVDPEDKRITIRLSPDRSRYQPGEHATVAITTTGPGGRPVAADVVVQGVDEKLFTIGLAADEDPAQSLMLGTSAGFLQSYTSHRLPVFSGDGCGAGGGGDRAEFKDSVTFQRITTGPDGRGSVAFDLPDDLTSWHLTAIGVDAQLDSGFAAVQLPVGLPFFVDAVLAPEYLSGETPVLRMGAFGRALKTGDAVQYTVEAPSLGLDPTRVRGRAFVGARLALPTLVAGDHRIRIAAEATIGGRTYRDTLIRTIHVGATRLTGLVSSYDMLDEGFTPQGGPGFTTYAISDAGRGRLIELLETLAWDHSGRFDKLAAADVARRLLIEQFGFAADSLPPVEFDASRYQAGGGISLLSYSSTDLFLSARAALAAPDLINRSDLRAAFEDWATGDQITPERILVALVGRAGLGDDVLAQLHAYRPADLTVPDRLWLALGLAAAGDEDSARAIERDLLESAGQRLGPWVRLSAGPAGTDTEATGLLLLLASRLGDPLAADISTYLRQVPSNDVVFPLEQLGYVDAFLDRLPRNPGKFAWTVAGERHEVTLEPGGAVTLALTSEQRRSLKLERLDGDLAVVTGWSSPDFQPPASSTIRMQRTVSPANDAPDDRLVHVTITVDFGLQPVPGCYRLTDLVPSGLSPVAQTADWPSDDGDATLPSNANWPYLASGQEVSWCASPTDVNRTYVYAARVVSPGTYRWEPAILQFELDPRIGTATQATTFTIR